MSTITKKELIDRIAHSTQAKQSLVKAIVQNFLDEIISELAKGSRLEFRDFGVFEIVTRKQKVGRNPKNASVPIIIPARPAVKFTAGKKMKKLIEKAVGAKPLQHHMAEGHVPQDRPFCQVGG